MLPQHRVNRRPSPQPKKRHPQDRNGTGNENGTGIAAGSPRTLRLSQHRHDPVLVSPPAPASAGRLSQPDNPTRRRGHGR